MIRIGLLTNRISSANYGVGALSISNLLLIETACNDLGMVHEYTLFGNSLEDEELLEVLKNKIELLKGITITFAPDLELRKLKSYASFVGFVNQCDILFDTSGGDSFADIYGNVRLIHQVIPKMITLMMGKNLVFSPQTIGPFKNVLWKKLCGHIMKNSMAIFARDSTSFNLARSMKVNNCFNVTDMAMILPCFPVKQRSNGRLRIGVNVSGLLFNGGYSRDNQFGLISDYPVIVEEVIKLLTGAIKCDVFLVPHVITTGIESDNEVCEMLKKKHPQVHYEGAFCNPVDTKSYISTMDFFIGSRMHATIAAISSGVPVIPLSYSRKFEGLFNSIGYKECIDLTELEVEEVIYRVQNAIADIDRLYGEVLHAQTVIEEKMTTYRLTLNKLLERYI